MYFICNEKAKNKKIKGLLSTLIVCSYLKIENSVFLRGKKTAGLGQDTLNM